MSSIPPNPLRPAAPVISRLLDRTAARQRWVVASDLVTAVATVTGVVLFAGMLATRSGFGAATIGRLIAATLLVTAAAAGVMLWRGLRGVGPARTAFLLDRYHGLPDTLASAHAFAQDPRAGALARLHTHRAESQAATLSPTVPTAGRRGPRFVAAVVVWIAVLAGHAGGLGQAPLDAMRSVAAEPVDGQPAAQASTAGEAPASAPVASPGPARSGTSAALGPGRDADPAARPTDMPSSRQAPVSPPNVGPMTAVGPGRVGDAARHADTAEILAARADLAQALSALFKDAEPAPDDTTTQAGGIGLPETKKPRRVESPRGGSEAGRTHLAVGGDAGQGEVAPLRGEGTRSATPPPPAEGRWQSDKPEDAAGGRMAPVNAAIGSQGGGGVAPSGQSSEGVQSAELALGPEVPVAAGRTTPATLGPALASRGSGGERLRERVPTTLQATRIPLTGNGTYTARAARESVREDAPLSAEYRAAARDYALSLNRSTPR